MWQEFAVAMVEGGLGATDCEAIRAGWLSQPVNAWSSLGYVLAGAWTWAQAAGTVGRSMARFWLAASLVAVGMGSFLFHGPMPPGARWIHDATILVLLALLAVLAAAGSRNRPESTALRWWVPFGGLAAVTAAFVPEASPVLAAIGVALVVVLEIRHWRPPIRRGALSSGGVLLLGAAFYVLGRTGGPWCVPSSGLQGHALWHVLTSIALAAYGSLALSRLTQRRRSEPASGSG